MMFKQCVSALIAATVFASSFAHATDVDATPVLPQEQFYAPVQIQQEGLADDQLLALGLDESEDHKGGIIWWAVLIKAGASLVGNAANAIHHASGGKGSGGHCRNGANMKRPGCFPR